VGDLDGLGVEPDARDARADLVATEDVAVGREVRGTDLREVDIEAVAAGVAAAGDQVIVGREAGVEGEPGELERGAVVARRAAQDILAARAC
jgi:hypothetical protein